MTISITRRGTHRSHPPISDCTSSILPSSSKIYRKRARPVSQKSRTTKISPKPLTNSSYDSLARASRKPHSERCGTWLTALLRDSRTTPYSGRWLTILHGSAVSVRPSRLSKGCCPPRVCQSSNCSGELVPWQIYREKLCGKQTAVELRVSAVFLAEPFRPTCEFFVMRNELIGSGRQSSILWRLYIEFESMLGSPTVKQLCYRAVSSTGSVKGETVFMQVSLYQLYICYRSLQAFANSSLRGNIANGFFSWWNEVSAYGCRLKTCSKWRKWIS